MKVFGIEGLTLRELVDRVKDGGRFVCIVKIDKRSRYME